MKLYIYTFEDGTDMKIFNYPLTLDEIFALEGLHGESILDTIEAENE